MAHSSAWMAWYIRRSWQATVIQHIDSGLADLGTSQSSNAAKSRGPPVARVVCPRSAKQQETPPFRQRRGLKEALWYLERLNFKTNDDLSSLTFPCGSRPVATIVP